MPRSGSGVFSRVYNWVNDRDSALKINASRMDDEFDGVATALSESIARDGQTTTTAQIPFAAGIATNTVAERTSNSGVTIDSVLLKDGRVDSTKGVDVASAATTDIWAATGNYIDITGTVAITSFGTAAAAGNWRILQFDAALTLTHGANLDIPGNANITTAAGDRCMVVADTTTAHRVLWYQRDATLIDINGLTENTTPDVLSDYVVVYTQASQANRKVLLSKIEKIAQVVNTQTGAVATGTTQIPADDTIPQNTEGDQYMTLAITPKNINSTLIIDVVWIGASSIAGATIAAALYQDSTANALAVGLQGFDVASRFVTVKFTHKMTAGTLSATTFKVRAGSGSAGTTTFNGAGGARFYGGVLASSITITEILP